MAKTVLITGTSSGIGKASAKYFQSQGWNVIATMRSPEKETELQNLKNVLVTRLDMADKESIHNSIKEGIAKFGKIDVLVNNAGVGSVGQFEAATELDMKKQFHINVFGVMKVIQAILPYFRENKEGCIINISSVGGRVAMPYFAIYNGSKFAIEGISEGLYLELMPLNIKVKLVEPGATGTKFGDNIINFYDPSLEEYNESFQNFMDHMQDVMENTAEDPINVAKVIFEAASDDKNTLRYLAGEDTKAIMALRESSTDEEFFKINVAQDMI